MQNSEDRSQNQDQVGAALAANVLPMGDGGNMVQDTGGKTNPKFQASRDTNPKSKILNPKQIQNQNIKCPKPWLTTIVFFF
jgi:hypothetical protein